MTEENTPKACLGVSLVKLAAVAGPTNLALVKSKFYFNLRKDSSGTPEEPNGVCTSPIAPINLAPCP